MKLPSTLDLVLYGALALGAGALLFTVNHWRTQAAEYKVAKVEWKRTLAAKDARIAEEIDNTRKANDASSKFQGRVRALEDQRTADGFGVVRMCRRPVLRLPQASAASGSDAAAAPDDSQPLEADRDIGPELDQYGTESELNLIQVDELQAWIRSACSR